MIYTIDRNDVLVHVDGAVGHFAGATGVPNLCDGAVGQSLWTFIADDELRSLYVALVARARGGRVVHVSTRCDSPSMARSVAMEIAPRADGGVEFTCRLDDAALIARVRPGGSDLLRLCAWCYRADRGGWRDIEEVIASEQLLERSTLPVVTHGICDACLAEAAAKLDPLTASA
jgi:hypothetical protein